MIGTRAATSLGHICLVLLAAQGSLFGADCNRNLLEDSLEIATGEAGDCNQNGIPDGCDLLGFHSFGSAHETVFRTGAAQLALADLDGDGSLDIAGSNKTNVCAYLARSDWSVENSIVSFPGSHLLDPQEHLFVAGDFNGDGLQDLATADASGLVAQGSSRVFLNRGNALFEPARSKLLGSLALSVIGGDWNSDGTDDFAALASYPRDLQILLSSGDGKLRDPQIVPCGVDAQFLESLDYEGDGDLDLASIALTEPGKLLIFTNDGSGQFSAPVTAGGTEEISFPLVSEDFNGDAYADLVTSGDNRAALFMNQGGSLAPPSFFEIEGKAWHVLEANDVTGDGFPDLLVTNLLVDAAEPDSFSVLAWDRNTGGFQPRVDFASAGPFQIVSGDLNGDFRADVVVSGKFGPWMHINELNPLFGAGQRVGRGPDSYLRRLEAGELNGDGAIDLAVQNQGRADDDDPGATQVLWNDGDGSLTNIQSLADGSVRGDLRISDLDADGHMDIVVAGSGGAGEKGLYFFWGGGGQAFARSQIALPAEPSLVASGHLDQDQAPDLVVGGFEDQPSQLNVLISRADRTFTSRDPISVPGLPIAASIGDLNADGKGDIVSVSHVGLSVLLQGAESAFTSITTYPVDLQARSAILQDLTGDGMPELITEGGAGSVVLWFQNRGDGTFEPPNSLGGSEPALTVAASDLDGNGFTDVVVGLYDSGVELRSATEPASRSRATFFRSTLESGRDVYSVAIADLTGDGLMDLSAAHFGGVTVFENLFAPPEPDANSNGVLDACESTRFERGDADATGVADLSDAVFLVDFLFLGGRNPPCDDAADSNRDLRIDLSDAIFLLGYLFLGSAEPPAPFPGCGMVPGKTGLGCDAFGPCS